MDTLDEYILNITNGNKKAVAVFKMLLQKKDSANYDLSTIIKVLDEYQITGIKIYKLFKDACNKDIDKFYLTIKLFGYNIFTKKEILDNLKTVKPIPFINDKIKLETTKLLLVDPKFKEYCHLVYDDYKRRFKTKDEGKNMTVKDVMYEYALDSIIQKNPHLESFRKIYSDPKTIEEGCEKLEQIDILSYLNIKGEALNKFFNVCCYGEYNILVDTIELITKGLIKSEDIIANLKLKKPVPIINKAIDIKQLREYELNSTEQYIAYYQLIINSFYYRFNEAKNLEINKTINKTM
jgi:hypothetical protein